VSAPWLTRWRVVGIAAWLMAASAGIVWLHRSTVRDFLGGAVVALPYSASIGAGVLGDWVATRDGQARTVAALVAAVPPAERLARVPALLEAVRSAGGFTDARWVRNMAAPTPLRVGVRDDSLTTVDLVAPVDSAREWIVLQATLTEATFRQFNAAAPDDRTQRTTLVAGGDAPRLLVVSAAGGGARDTAPHASIPAGARLSGDLRGALVDARRPTAGFHTGVMGEPVVFARAPVPGTPWWLLRERDVRELRELLQMSLLVNDATLALIALLVAGVTLLLWRAAWLRRERDAMTLRSTFVSSMSHELRTPLTQIRMYAELLRLRLLPTQTDTDRALQVIEKEAGRLSHLVDRSLAFARTGQSGSTEAPRDNDERTELAAAARDAVAAMAPLAAERGVTLVRDVPDALSARIGADALQQVLLNLLDNALKYGPHGQRILLSAWHRGDDVLLAVDDEGPGVPAAERARVWDAFVRGAAARDGAAGSGIGLAVVRDLVTRAGGTAAIVERPGGQPGMRVLLTLPAILPASL